MSHGHCTGHKKEKKHASDWYREQEEANIRAVDAAWAARQAAHPVAGK